MHFTLNPDFEFEKMPSATSTAAYNPHPPLPNQTGRPTFLIHDEFLPTRMLESLRIYLERSPRCNTECTPDLVQTVARLRRRLVDFVLSDEYSTHSLFERIFDPISSAVEEVDANPTCPEATTQRLSHNQIPDMLL
jgi:hypothetical protein